MTFPILEWILLIPTIVGAVFAVLCLFAALRLCARPAPPARHGFAEWPPVTMLKPVCGLEKNLKDNLRSACRQDYPEFQVVFSVQDPQDPAVPLLQDIQREFGPDRVSVAVENRPAGCNGKINNLIGGLVHARYEILVISDSDVRLRPDYLKAIVAPLTDPDVGCVCTLYKAAGADTWFEKLELLTLNVEFMANVVFAHVTGAARFCLGASTALRRSTLKEIGGLEALADYLVEDYEMGRRIWMSGRRVAIVPYFVDTMVDLKTAGQWWGHQTYWDQNTRAARPGGFFATVLVRSVPFALLFALARMGDPVGLAVLGAAVGLRLATAAAMLGWGFRDREGLHNLALLPVRDVAALLSWLLAFTKRTVVWRGAEFILTRDGRLIAKEEAESCESLSSPATTSVSPSR
jgi:ceramide glucosyltransferase